MVTAEDSMCDDSGDVGVLWEVDSKHRVMQSKGPFNIIVTLKSRKITGRWMTVHAHDKKWLNGGTDMDPDAVVVFSRTLQRHCEVRILS